MSRYLVVGGAGFLGGHFVDRLLVEGATQAVTVFDNFSSGRRWPLEVHRSDTRLRVLTGDVKDLPALTAAAEGAQTVIHLASNPDIARAAGDPAVDFDEGTRLTHHVVEAMRMAGSRLLLYASGSGVYGDLGERVVGEDHGPLRPISTYGASKLAGEALICSYCHMFGLTARAFRFGNVVGPRQTHGVGFDFLRRLLADPGRLEILGDGRQSKSYIHVSDVIDAVLLAAERETTPFQVYNVATGDHLTVTEIAELAVECVGRAPGSTSFVYGGGDRGWKGDVPVVRLDSGRIRALGWRNRMSSRQALRAALAEMREDANAGRLW